MLEGQNVTRQQQLRKRSAQNSKAFFSILFSCIKRTNFKVNIEIQTIAGASLKHTVFVTEGKQTQVSSLESVIFPTIPHFASLNMNIYPYSLNMNISCSTIPFQSPLISRNKHSVIRKKVSGSEACDPGK